jgi:uncharacterized protein
MKQNLGSKLADRLARFVMAKPYLLLAVSLAVAAGATAITSKLAFDTGFSALLPDSAPEVLEVNDLIKKAGGTVELIIAVSGDKKKRLDFAKKLVLLLRAKPWIRRADVEFPVDFFTDRKMLLLPLEDLQKVHEAIDDEIQRAKARANPLYVDLEDDAPTPWAEVDKRQQLAKKKGLLRTTYETKGGRHLLVRVKPMGTTLNMDEGKRLLGQVKAVVTAAKPAEYGISVRYAGGLPVNQTQHRRMTEDLTKAAMVALVAVVLILSFYVRRLTAPIVVAIPLVAGLMITLAITKLAIGKLNLVSGFLVTALIGLGIDFEIHLYLRFLEKLGISKSRRQAMTEAIKDTFTGCLTAAITTAAAFFAMAISGFRGYREYGQIAGTGVLVAFLSAYLILPPIALLLSRKGRQRDAKQTSLGAFFRYPLAWTMVIVGLLMAGYSVYVGQNVRIHNDFEKLMGQTEVGTFSAEVDEVLGGSLAPTAILVDNVEQARRVEKFLKPKEKDPNSGVKTVFSVASMTPDRWPQRAKLLKKIEVNLQEVLKEKLTKKDRKRIEDALKSVRMKPWTTLDIPDVFRKQFMTIDEKGTFVLIWPRWKLKADVELVAWGKELTEIQNTLREKGLAAPMLDQNRIVASVLRQMEADAPYVVAYALIAVVIILLIDFRDPRKVLLVAGSLGLGVVWLMGVMDVYGIDVNVFNQALIPTVIGLGIDNAVHLQHRYSKEGKGSIPYVVSTTGSASFLATATTAVGFGASILARHNGIKSMGMLALAGLACTFVATTIFFPSLLRLQEGRGTRKK